jgi:diguanylate cyclase (GGDEF)-like protein/PAS domain S-box-containing protein
MLVVPARAGAGPSTGNGAVILAAGRRTEPRPSGRRRFLLLPGSALERARLVALCLALLLAVDLVGSIPPASQHHIGPELATIAVGWLSWHWLRTYRRRNAGAVWTLPEGAMLLLIAVLAGPERALGLFYVGICFRALFIDGSIALTWLTYVLAYTGALVLTAYPAATSIAVSQLLTHAGGLGATAGVVYGLATSIRQQEKVMSGLKGMENTEASLAASGTREQLYTAALQAALAVVGGASTTACLNLGAGDEIITVATAGPIDHSFWSTSVPRRVSTLASRIMPTFLKTAPVRLVLDGPSGLEGTMEIASRRRVSAARLDGLAVLAGQTAVALANMRLRDELDLSSVNFRYRSLVLANSDLITVVAEDGIIRYQGPSMMQMLGYVQTEFIGKALTTALLHPDDVTRARTYIADLAASGEPGKPIEWRLRHHDGSWRQVETVGASRLSDPHLHGIILTSRDISDRKGLEQQLLDQAARDPLTDLANRSLFGDQLARALRAGDRSSAGVAVLFLDLDNFKAINDQLGHEAGDSVLREVAERLRHCLRLGDLAARLGGDEFAVMLNTDTRADLAPRVAERILAALRPPFLLAGQEVTVGVSIGIAMATTNEEAPSTLLRKADMAMYEAKHDGKGGYRVAKATSGSPS